MASETELHQAAKKGDVARIETLIERGASVHQLWEHGWTFMHVAASKGHADAIKVLLDAGVAPKARNAIGSTALNLINRSNPIYDTSVYWRLHDAKFEQ